MTALIYELDPEYVIVAMDTLLLLPNKKPSKYADKIFPLLHLNGAVCATGYMGLLAAWGYFIETQPVVRDIFSLIPMIPKLLDMAKKLELPNDDTTTLYHFGYSKREKSFGGFAVEVKEDVKVRELEQNTTGIKTLGSKDLSDEYLAIREEKGPFDAMTEIIKRLKVIDESGSIEDRSGIGGEIHILHMRPGDQLIINYHRFEDYDKVFEEMISNPDLIWTESSP